ncbi:MAG TPA: C13 family peptidase, partial [Pirellulales bacterium]
MSLLASPLLAADHFLTIGGGYSPHGNQVSLEKNVLFFQTLLGKLNLTGSPHDIFFSDGDSPQRDLQFIDPAQAVPKINRLLAQLFGKEDDLDARFRTHQVPGIRGGSSPENLDRWFDEVGKTLKPGDRLVIYLTGHGGKGQDIQNPHFYMWQRRQWPMKDFVTRLDKLDPQVRVVLVMVQCYSGGFANCIFNEGDSKKGITAANRCGFYATVHNRPAAGCTPDIAEENYQEYSSSFWSAICGQTRTGQPVAPPDYDGDGKVSFAEAHAYTVLTSNTIDIPVKTSDAFLRAVSKTKDDNLADLVTPDASYDTLEQLATPVERSILKGLSDVLSLSGTERTKGARDLAAELEKQRGAVNNEKKKLQGNYNGLRGTIAESLKLRWPELENPWHPQVTEDIQRESQEIVAAIEAHPKFSEFAKLHDQIEEHSTKSLDLERRWVKCQRFVHLT